MLEESLEKEEVIDLETFSIPADFYIELLRHKTACAGGGREGKIVYTSHADIKNGICGNYCNDRYGVYYLFLSDSE